MTLASESSEDQNQLDVELVSQRIRAFSFDLDDTLVHGAEYHRDLRQICSLTALEHAEVDAERLFQSNAEAWASYFPVIEKAWALGIITTREVMEETWRRSLAGCGVFHEAAVRTATAVHGDFGVRLTRLFDDAAALFDRLADVDVPVAVITSGPSDTQRQKLAAVGLLDRVDVFVASADIGIVKPDRRIFEFVVNALGVSLPELYHVGDNLLSDVAGAVGAGAVSVWINRRNEVVAPDRTAPHYTVTSLVEVAQLVGGT